MNKLTRNLAWFLGPLLIICNVAAQTTLARDSEPLRTPEARAAAKVVTDYYRARDRFDFPTARSLEGNDIILVNEKGEERKAHPEKLQGFMDYEKYMHGGWHCRILGFHDGWIEAQVIEDNDYYRYLGSGRSIRTQRFWVADGKIQREQMVENRFDGEHQDSAADKFLAWVKEVHPEKLEQVHPNGHLVFDGEGARQQLPLMKEYHRTRKQK
jgi:hypothetical protein